MIFIVITFIAAFLIEGLGTLVSVIGLSALFGSNPIIIALAIALDLGKIVVVSFLYTHWQTAGKLMKGYALAAATVTMIITSAGASGYLSGEFQKAILGTQETGLKVSVLKEQQQKYQARKQQIDMQIASLPEKTTVNQRLRLMNGFKAEQQALDAKISEIDKSLPELQISQIGVEAKAGPILYVAKAFNIPVEEAVKWVILMIIFVFDPLAIFLIVAGNFLLKQHRTEKSLPKENVVLAEPAQQIPVAKFEEPETKVEIPKIEDTKELALIPIQQASEDLEPQSPIFEVLEPTKLEPVVEAQPETKREEVTLSSLGFVRSDPDTIVDAGQVSDEAREYRTGVYKPRSK